jgi:threonine aldolase
MTQSDKADRNIIDLRSDTVTKPTAAMREAMARAEVGDDVLGDDPTVIALERRFAEMLGKEAAVFVPSGTMANQIAIKVHTQPGDEIICHEGSHIIHYEGGGPAALAGCMVKGLAGLRGQFSASEMLASIRHDNVHYPRTRLVSLENTHNRGGGAVWALADITSVTDAARSAGLATHLDGARAWNACAAGNYTPTQLAASFDSISMCFSKGLGAPIGSALAGSEAFITQGRRVRKLFGGGMRQAGILAAACLYALDHHVERLRDDHANAKTFADLIARIPGIKLSAQHAKGIETNIVLFELDSIVPMNAAELTQRLKTRGVLMLPTGERSLRAVANLEVTAEAIKRAAAEVANCVAK